MVKKKYIENDVKATINLYKAFHSGETHADMSSLYPNVMRTENSRIRIQIVVRGDKMTELELIRTLSAAIDFYKTFGSRSITVYIDYRTSNVIIDEVIKKFHEEGYGMRLCIDLYALQKFILINW